MKNSFEEVEKVRRLMDGFERPWFICGGWAVDLHLNRETRKHGDIEIGIFREDQSRLYSYFGGWSFKVARPGHSPMSPWNGEQLNLPIHEIHATNGLEAIEVLLNQRGKEGWLYRRCEEVILPTSRAILHRESVPYLAPEIVLLYKSRHTREKDHLDFRNIINSLEKSTIEWLIEALRISEDKYHPWITELSIILDEKDCKC